MKKTFNFIIKVSISIALLIFLFSRIDFRKTILYIRSVEPLSFIYAVVIFIFVDFLGIIRWNVLLEILKKDLTFGRIFVSHCGGLFFNLFLPSSIGGDVAKTVDLSLHTKDSSAIFATVLLDRLFGFFGLVLIAIFGFLYGYFLGLFNDFRLFLIIVALTIILIGIFSVLFSKNVFNLINRFITFESFKNYFTKFHNSCYSFRAQKKALLKTLLLSIVIQWLFSIVFYFVAISLGIKLDVIYFLVFIPIVNTISMLPISLGGLGVRDNATVVLFSTLGVASDKVAAMTLIIFIYLFFIGIVGGIIYGIALYTRRL